MKIAVFVGLFPARSETFILQHALGLAKRGHQVIAATHSEEQAKALTAEHPDLTSMKLDVTNDNDVASAAGLGIDVLINNAGVGVAGPLSTMPMAEIRRAFDVNVFGMFAYTQVVNP